MDISTRLSDGGFPAWPLPLDATCAEFARSIARALCREFRLPRDVTCDVTLIASELATNALLHAYRTTPSGGGRPEMWAYLRRHAGPEIVFKVFDPVVGKGPPSRPPQSPPTDSTGGRGLHLVDVLTAEHGGRWGVHPTRGRLGASPALGKAVFFTVPLPVPLAAPVPERAPRLPRYGPGHGRAAGPPSGSRRCSSPAACARTCPATGACGRSGARGRCGCARSGSPTGCSTARASGFPPRT
ncbi:ATP-binding protein [Microtetraspora malaysiensis]|uniref:ATP-binding protein n=1 Tax=Microtetraspora malaysiensis TaxID=161358 RepID=UPI003D8B1951